MAKIYIAINENKVTTFKTWNACKEFVEQHRGAVCKSFEEEDADGQKLFIDRNIRRQVEYGLDGVPYAFVSSGRSNDKKQYAYGYAIVRDGKVDVEGGGILKFKPKVEKPKPEITSTIMAIEDAIDAGDKRIIIMYSFNKGLELWANGSWKPKDAMVEWYVERITQLKEQIIVDFLNVDDVNPEVLVFMKQATDKAYKALRTK